MTNLLGNFTPSSGAKRLVLLLRRYGLWQTAAVCAAMIDDVHLRSFDRKYGVRTSGHIELSETSFDPSKLDKATSYGPVNAWGLRKLLTILNLPKSFTFADLGCGMGRACIVAAEYGFAKVTGIELAPELCKIARENVASALVPGERKRAIQIIEGDVSDYCDHSNDDVYFMYRAFSLPFLNDVLTKLIQSATDQQRSFVLIYTERLNWPMSRCVTALAGNRHLQKMYEWCMLGQAFFVYRCER